MKRRFEMHEFLVTTWEARFDSLMNLIHQGKVFQNYMTTKICFTYPWATFGGCERVFINRAIAFTYFPEVRIDFFFF